MHPMSSDNQFQISGVEEPRTISWADLLALHQVYHRICQITELRPTSKVFQTSFRVLALLTSGTELAQVISKLREISRVADIRISGTQRNTEMGLVSLRPLSIDRSEATTKY